MSIPEGGDRPNFVVRFLLAGMAAGIIGVFATAVWLKPDPRGFGTHQQLGLPACQFRQFTGFHCPHCGMTTSFSNVVRGNFGAAWRANPLGIPLFGVCALCIPWCLTVSITGKWIGTQEPFRWFVFGTMGYLALAVAFWILRVLF